MDYETWLWVKFGLIVLAAFLYGLFGGLRGQQSGQGQPGSQTAEGQGSRKALE